MGVPKLFRWLSERYPMVSEVIGQKNIPAFDHCYLDMNAIIHNCSHPNDDDTAFRISEQQIFTSIFAYIGISCTKARLRLRYHQATKSLYACCRRRRSSRQDEPYFRLALSDRTAMPALSVRDGRQGRRGKVPFPRKDIARRTTL